VLFTGHDESGYIPAGYTAETGLTVGGTEVAPFTTHVTTLQAQVKCQATRVKCSAACRRFDGVEQQIDFTDEVAPAGEYFVSVEFGIQDASNRAEVEAKLELKMSNGLKRVVKSK
jgi:hypothetical protein